MKISVPKRSWAKASHVRHFEKLAKHVMNHYPKDTALHKAVRDSFKSMNDAATKLTKSARKAAPKRARKSTARRSAPRRGSTARRRPTTRRRGMRRRKSA